ncbi:GNAT family N-acetyltransferase [Microbacteriaceae bacterium 4G12]
MKLETARLTLIPCTEEIVAQAQEYEAGDHVFMYLEKLRKNPDLLGWGVWYVVERATNKVVGDMGFKGKLDEDRTVEVGYGILSFAQGKGYATESVQTLIEWALLDECVDTIVAECLETNAPSIRVLEKVGMKRIDEQNGMIYWKRGKINELSY